MQLNDTITAVATPPGQGGIGIIRINGTEALAIGEAIFVSPTGKKIEEMDSYTMVYGHIVDPDTKETIDEVVVSVMLAPKTYTRENMVEVNCHGGIVSLKRVLELILRQGARMAQPGEFAKRAFLNGRIDLPQAEAVIDVIRSQTETSLKVALGQLEGNLSEALKDIRENIIFMLAYLEAAIDFPEEDIEEMDQQELRDRVEAVYNHLAELIATADSGKLIREGLKTAIIGRPNVGKSSLLNALLREKRAIVTDIPGTTRDIIEEVMNIRGIPVKIVDTAGIRTTEDLVEKIGVERAKKSLEQADLVILLLNSSEPLTEQDQEIFRLAAEKKKIILLNKSDLPREINIAEIEKMAEGAPIIQLSLKEATGLNDLEQLIEEAVFTGQFDRTAHIMVTNTRHKYLLEQAKESMSEVLDAVIGGMPPDLISIDLKNTLYVLGEITGETVNDDVMDKIFSQFCLGK